MSSDQRAILTGICVTVMLGILFTNVILKICLFKINQTGNPSLRTILLLSFTNVLLALIAFPTFIFGRIIKIDSCVLQIASPFFNSLLPYPSVYLIELIGVDRFITTECYTKHRETLTPFHVFVIHILIWGIALLNAIFAVLELLYKIRPVPIFIVLCDATLVILVVILQIKTIFSKKTVLVLLESPLDQKIGRLAIKILVSITVPLSFCMICAIVLGNIQVTLNIAHYTSGPICCLYAKSSSVWRQQCWFSRKSI